MTSDIKRPIAFFDTRPDALHVVLRSMVYSFVIIDNEGVIIEMNPAAEQVLGCSLAAVVGKSLIELMIPAAEQSSYERHVKLHIETGDQQYLNEWMEITAIRGDNRDEFPAELAVIPFSDGGKHFFGVFIRDISERKREQNALAEERKLLRVLIDTAPDFIYIKDIQHRFILTNMAHARARGCSSPDELIGKTDYDFFPENMASQFAAEEDEIFRTGVPLIGHEQSSYGDKGGFIWASSNKVPLHNLEGELIGLVGITHDITVRKEQEQQLQHHASLQQNLSDAVISTDLQFRIQSWNRAAERIYGWQAEEVIGKLSSDILRTNFESNQIREQLAQDVISQGWWRGEVIQKRQDGTALYMLSSVNLLHDSTGKPFGFVAVNHDISSNKQSEQKLRYEGARLRHLISNIQGGILLESETRHIDLVNTTFCEMFEIMATPEDLIGTDCSRSAEQSMHLFADPQEFVERIQVILRDRQPVLGDTLHLITGQVYERDYIPIRIGNDDVGHLWHYRDVTLEFGVRKRWEQLFQLEELNKYIIRQFSQSNDVENTLGNILEMTGHSLDVSRIYVFHFRENERLLDNTYEWCAPGGDPKIDKLQGLQIDLLAPTFLPILAQDGIISPQNISVIADEVRALLHRDAIQSVMILPLYSNGRLEGFLGCEDTRATRTWLPEETTTFRIFAESYARALEDQQTQRLLIEARDSALRTARLRTQFVANMSHEIRTPMTGILGMLELLRETLLDPDQQEFADEAFNSAHHLLNIINDILDFSKLDAGQFVLETNDIDICSLASEVQMSFAPQLRSKPVTITLDIENDVPAHVIGDPTRLRQVLVNLVGNAVKFTAQGHVAIGMKVLSRSEKRVQLRFEVADTGIGIALDDQERIFESFVQTDSTTTRKYGGTGLGLAITRQLVESMGGQIDLTSVPGEGSTFGFTLSLPVVNISPSEAVQEANEDTPSVSEVSPVAYQGRILLAEDYHLNVRLVTHALIDMGAVIDIAGNGQVVLEYLMKETYDLILMDMQMPVMDGREATRLIRESSAPYRDIPIIALTASVMRDEQEHYYELGVNAIIGKPFAIEELRLAVQQWLPTKG